LPGQSSLLCKKCREKATTGKLLVLESPTGLEDRNLSRKHKTSSLAQDQATADICELYPRREPSIWKHPEQKRWMKWSRSLEDTQLLGVMSDEGRGLFRGCYWGVQTRHGVIDVDTNSKYHSVHELSELVHKFTSIGLPLTPYQSSNSGGWHLYFFLDDWALSTEVESTIKGWLKVLGYTIQSGTLEIFPSGNALRLPLQQGFAWLAPDGKIKVRREEITRDEALASFLLDMRGNARNWQEAKSLIESQILSAGRSAGAGDQGEEETQNEEGFEGLFKGGLDWERYQRGRDYWQTGLTDKSQRHDAILCVGHYLWYGDKAAGVWPLPYARNAKVRAQKIEEWLEGKHNGQSRAVNSGDWVQVTGDIKRAASWTRQPLEQQKKYEPYPITDRLLKRLQWLYDKTGKLWTIEELEKANIDRSLDARQRIAIAVAQLDLEGSEVDQAKVARRAKACRKTVRKNQDLLDRWGGVYSGGRGGSSGQPVLFAAPLPTPSSDCPGSVLADPDLSLPLLEASPVFEPASSAPLLPFAVISGFPADLKSFRPPAPVFFCPSAFSFYALLSGSRGPPRLV
jgi:hypothetical protein